MHEGSDQELIQGPAQRIPRSGRRLTRTDDQPEDVDRSNASASDEDFRDENSVSDQDPGEEEEAEEDGFPSVPYWDQSR